jgi:hypothetical protein
VIANEQKTLYLKNIRKNCSNCVNEAEKNAFWIFFRLNICDYFDYKLFAKNVKISTLLFHFFPENERIARKRMEKSFISNDAVKLSHLFQVK